MSEIRFTFDGRPVTARAGQTLAAALTDAGIRAFRETAKGGTRGIFCGMGICQDCLVSVDGHPNRRACMTKAAEGLAVATQPAFPRLDPDAPAPSAPPPPLRIAPDVLVIGGGAGGLSAAIAAARVGAEVVVLDERTVAGGQYYKQAADGSLLDPQQAEGAALVEQALEAGATLMGGVALWGAFDGLLFLGEVEGAALVARPRTAIVATGAFERPALIPGWTLPGVMTTGAAQTLWRSYRTLPGRRVAVCGSGPLNLQVALELARGGADVRLVAEAAPAPLARPIAAIATLLAGPVLTWKGVAMLAALRRLGVPVLNRTEATRIEQGPDGLALTVTGPNGAQRTETVDAVCTNLGFEPQNEILRLLGAAMTYDPAFGHLRCTRDERMETTVPGLYAVGDCAGLGGAPAARAEGRIAGRSAAARTGHGDAYDIFADARELRRHRRFQRRLWRLHDVAPLSLKNAPDDLTLCRCEEIDLGTVRGGHAENPGHLGTLKRGTRLGMGRCQGRYCGAAAARLLAQTDGRALEDRSFFAPRVPIKPVSIAAILAAEEALDGDL